MGGTLGSSLASFLGSEKIEREVRIFSSNNRVQSTITTEAHLGKKKGRKEDRKNLTSSVREAGVGGSFSVPQKSKRGKGKREPKAL